MQVGVRILSSISSFKRGFLVILIFAQSSGAWFDEGHEVVGEIAWRSLDDNTKATVTELLKHLEPAYSQASSLAKAGTIPDRMKGGFKLFDQWHYVTLPIMTYNATAPASKTPNSLWALCESVRTIATVTHTTRTPGYLPWAPNSFERAFMIAWLAHLVGDMHQPLHSVSRFTPTLPDGDMGGNLFPVRVGSKVTNLHLFWDSGLGYFNKQKNTDEIAQELMKEHPRASFKNKVEMVAFREWAQDGHNLAKNVVYDLPEGSEPTKEYTARGQKIVKERVALAGYRLAFLLTELLSERGASAIATGCSF